MCLQSHEQVTRRSSLRAEGLNLTSEARIFSQWLLDPLALCLGKTD